MKYLLLALWLTGCASLKPDPVPGASESGYPTAEFVACGQRFVGLGVCQIRENQSLQALGIKVQGYYSGAVRIDSERCNIGLSLRYSDSEAIPVPLSGIATQSCVIDFTVSPEYPHEQNSELVIKSLKGRLYIKYIAGPGDFFSDNDKVKIGLDTYLQVPSTETGSVHVAFRGCGVQYDHNTEPDQGWIRIALHDLKYFDKIENCIFEGVVQGKKTTRIVWQVWAYSDKFIELPIPKIKQSSSGISVQGDDAVSIIALDDEFKIASKTSFKFDKTEPHVLRLITVGGRVTLGEWDGEKWTWKN